jgi:pimeloyl-ACP methyl ester carboxylesterase
LREAFREYARPGPLGAAWETVAIAGPWGLRLAEISIPVHLWHGEQDPIVGLASQEFAAKTIPGSHLTIWPDAGHFGIAKYWRQVLEAVTTTQ